LNRAKLGYVFLMFIWGILSCNNPHTPNTKNINKKANSETNKNLDPVNYSDTTELTIYATGNTMYNMAFEPKVVYAKSNTLIKVSLINHGTDTMMIHNIIFVQKGKADEMGVKALRAGVEKSYIPDHPAVIAASSLVQPLDSVQLNFPAPPVGTYPFICSYPGHYLQMRGRLVVKP